MEKYIRLKNGAEMPRLGMGTWYLGEDMKIRDREIEALKTGIESGMNMIDTAEMYGNGLSEQLVGQVVREYKREDLFLVSKICPSNVAKNKFGKRLRHSLSFMRTDYLDLYLLHWRGNASLRETVYYMEEMVAEGKIKNWGVSNFDIDDMEELLSIPGGENCAVNQVLYHLGARGIEYDLLPWQKERGIPIMAYCPLAQAGSLYWGMLRNEEIRFVAEKHGIKPIQVLLAFVLNQENVAAIPRSGRKEHVLENMEAAEIILDDEDRERLDRAFPPPEKKVPLQIV